MAKLICILGYVIAIISVLSNAQIISINKNNQYADNDVQVDAAAHNATTTTTTITTSTSTTTSSSTSIASTLNETTTPPPTMTAIDTGPPFINATAAAASETNATVADAETSGGRRSRYEEFDLDEPLPTDDDANDDASFEELTLDTDPDATSTVRPVVTASTRQPFISTQNIYKITKSTKSKSLKRSSSGTAAVLAQPLLEIRLSKPTSQTFGTEKQFNDVNAFRYITELFDQYQWNADDVRDDISSRCASDLDTFIRALVDGKAWATKASDASGRYRGQFLFGNDLWVGSLVICNELGNIDEMDLSFYIATVSLTSTEPLMKRHVLQVGQCLPQVCTGTDVRTILNADAAVIKFNEIYINATETGARKNGIRVINVRRVPGEYAITRDPAFYLTLCICVIVGALVVIATAYERSLQTCHGKRSHSLPTVHPIQMHNKQILSFEQTNISDEDTDSMKLNKIHASNILNGCTFELHPISIENDSNGTQSPPKPPPMPPSLPGSPLSSAILLEKNNQKNNQNGDDLYHLSHTNGTQPSNGNGNGNSKHHQNGSSHNNNNCNNNKNQHQHHHSTIVTHRKNSDTRNGDIVEKVDAKRLGTPQRLLLSFGLSTNIKTILSSKKLPQDSVSCIHGMRVFSMLWTIMVHTYLQTFGISENRFSKTITERTFLYQIIGNATYGVDTFFFLSGLLVTLLFLRTKESTKHPSDVSLASGTKQSLLLFVYRYVRLTPVYFVVIIINMVSLKYIYNGSVFPPGLPDHIVCPNYWWRNILYIQTWFPFHQLCMLWSWYLADDMQFYIWAIVLLILAKRHAKAAVTIIVTFLLTSWIVSAMVSLKFNYSLKVSEPLESFGFLYEKPWTRLGPYVMGMAAGYVLNRFKSPPKVSPFINLILWAMSLCIMFLLVFGVWNGILNPTWTAIYVSLGHTAWGFALIWITLSCKWGYAKPINDLLSYRPMLPLSRLTYCAYLIHPVTQIVMSFQLKGPVHIQHALVLTIFMGNAIISYTCALVLSLMFEAPVVRMLKILFGR